MNKIRVVNVKTGKFSEITENSLQQLKAGGHFKNFEIVTDNLKIQLPSKPSPIPANVVVDEDIPTMPQPEQSVEEAPATGDFVDIEGEGSSEQEEAPKKSKSKK